MALPKLDTLAIGWPITRLGVSFFPVYLAGNDLPAITTGESSELVVDELEEPSVQVLRVRNPGDKPVLVVEGEHFLGGKQNRAVNVTVLVPALADLEIPVSCLERGRWGGPRAAARDDSFAAAPVRAAQHAGVAASMRRSGSRAGDQGAVWDEVDAMLHRASVQSTTAAAADVKRAAQHREPSRAAAIEKLAARGPLPGQCGVVAAHGPWVASMDLFGSPHLLAAHWRALIRSHLLEPPVAKGRPSATRVLQVVRRFTAARTQDTPVPVPRRLQVLDHDGMRHRRSVGRGRSPEPRAAVPRPPRLRYQEGRHREARSRSGDRQCIESRCAKCVRARACDTVRAVTFETLEGDQPS